jgi:hypothetical protein
MPSRCPTGEPFEAVCRVWLSKRTSQSLMSDCEILVAVMPAAPKMRPRNQRSGSTDFGCVPRCLASGRVLGGAISIGRLGWQKGDCSDYLRRRMSWTPRRRRGGDGAAIAGSTRWQFRPGRPTRMARPRAAPQGQSSSAGAPPKAAEIVRTLASRPGGHVRESMRKSGPRSLLREQQSNKWQRK